MECMQGGLGAVKGLQMAGIWAGFRRNPERKDLALIVAPPGSLATGVFTQNTFCAAPVTVSKNHIATMAKNSAQDTGSSDFRALVINSGNANAATGDVGMQAAIETARIAADQLGCEPHQVLVASTGVIGVPLQTENFASGIPAALQALCSDEQATGTATMVAASTTTATDATTTTTAASTTTTATAATTTITTNAAIDAAEAIMTTDTVPKTAAVCFTATQSDGVEVTYHVGGMAKGSGMIEPHMATMIAVLATDAAITHEAANQALRLAVDQSFNKVTIDSDTSTNDSAFLIATGAVPGKTITDTCPLFAPFAAALAAVCESLAYQIAKDGEGATKVITVEVSGAASAHDANSAARAIANSPLVKTAVAGHDANWGRIAMAVGKSGAQFAQENVDISIMGLEVCRGGLAQPFSEEKALELFAEKDEVVIAVNLGAGAHATRIWTCDLTHEYISINGDYRT